MHNTVTPQYDVALMRADMRDRGWLPIDLARRAGVSHMTVSRFLSGERQTNRTVGKLARAFREPVKRYVVQAEAVA